jgi:isochorismate pyruvate lyase
VLARGAVEIDVAAVQTSNKRDCRGRAVTKSPAQCATKEDVRAEIDRIDQGLLALLAERHRYVTRMAQIKTDPQEAYDPERIEAVIKKQRGRATELDLDEDQAELIWRTLIDWNINYEKGIIVARKRME